MTSINDTIIINTFIRPIIYNYKNNINKIIDFTIFLAIYLSLSLL